MSQEIINTPRNTTLQETNKKLQEIADAIKAGGSSVGSGNMSVVSDKFSKDKNYSVGEYCIYNDNLYKFISEKTAGEWDAAVVQQTNVGTELNSLNSEIDAGSGNFIIQRGTAYTGDYTAAEQGKSVEITFPVKFKDNNVLVSIDCADGWIAYAVSFVTNTKFTVDTRNEYNGRLGTRKIYWQAIGYKSDD